MAKKLNRDFINTLSFSCDTHKKKIFKNLYYLVDNVFGASKHTLSDIGLLLVGNLFKTCSVSVYREKALHCLQVSFDGPKKLATS